MRLALCMTIRWDCSLAAFVQRNGYEGKGMFCKNSNVSGCVPEMTSVDEPKVLQPNKKEKNASNMARYYSS